MNNGAGIDQKPIILDRLENAPTTSGAIACQIKTEINIKQEIKTENEEYDSEDTSVVDSKEAVKNLIQKIKIE